MFPTISQYNHAILTGGNAVLRTNNELQFIPSRTIPLNIYHYGSGAYAVVFKATDLQKTYALRCFISAETENINRYRLITEYLSGIHASWLTPISLLENEFFVQGSFYPVLKMEWLDGALLNKYVHQNLSQNDRLTQLQEEFVRVNRSLEENHIGHGDIQCGNIIIQQNSDGSPRIRLIDYDGLYVPSLNNRKNLERGRSEFQHPNRDHTVFNERIDRFSFWVILCALEALKFDKSLWNTVMQGGFNTLDNMLFTGQDLHNFAGSPLIRKLYDLKQPSLNFYLDSINRFCHDPASSVDAPVMRVSDAMFDPIIVKEPQIEVVLPVLTDGLSDELLITCDKDAIVMDHQFRYLGSTPFSLSRRQFFGKAVLVSRGTKFERIIISHQIGPIKIDLPDQVSIPPVEGPIYPSAPLPVTNQKDPDNQIYYWIIGIIVAMVLIAIIVSEANKSSGSDFTSENTINSDRTFLETAVTVVDTMAAPYSPTVDTTVSYAPIVDTTAMPIDGYGTQGTNVIYDANNNTAEDVVRNFFLALDRQDCKTAWNYTFNPSWEAKGEAWFCSSDIYGSVLYASLNSLYVSERSTDKVILHCNYSFQYTNGSKKCFIQDITVSILTVGRWMIVNTENIVPPYYCVE